MRACVCGGGGVTCVQSLTLSCVAGRGACACRCLLFGGAVAGALDSLLHAFGSRDGVPGGSVVGPFSRGVQLDLRGNGVGDGDVVALADAIRHLPVSHVDLRHNSLSRGGLEDLAVALGSGTAQLGVDRVELDDGGRIWGVRGPGTAGAAEATSTPGPSGLLDGEGSMSRWVVGACSQTCGVGVGCGCGCGCGWGSLM